MMNLLESKLNFSNIEVFNRIFDKLNSVKDNVITPDETKVSGISVFGDSPITKEEFINKFLQYREKTSTLKGTLQDFQNVFESNTDDNIVCPAKLSDKQKKELLSRIEMFDLYYSVLNDKEKAEIEKNKHSSFFYATFFDFKPVPADYKFPLNFPEDERKNLTSRYLLKDVENTQYNEFISQRYKEIKKDLKSGKDVSITNEELAQLLRHTAINDLESDGKIGSFNQGNLGTCWFLSALISYASNPQGEENIKRRIKNNGDGTYTVIFQNPFNQNIQEDYIVDETDLSNYDSSKYQTAYSAGDIDVRILEIAANQYLTKYLPQEMHGKFPVSSGKPIKMALMHRAFGYSGDILKFGKLDDDNLKNEKIYGHIAVQVNRLFCQPDGKAGLQQKTMVSTNKSYVELIAKLPFNPQNMACCRNEKEYNKGKNKKESMYLLFEDAFSITKADKDKVVISQPYSPVFPHTLTKETFDNGHIHDIVIYPQDKLIMPQ